MQLYYELNNSGVSQKITFTNYMVNQVNFPSVIRIVMLKQEIKNQKDNDLGFVKQDHDEFYVNFY